MSAIAWNTQLGIPALRWVYGDDVGNIERMIDVSLQSIDNAFPNSKLIGYDSASNQFYRTDTGQRFANRGQLARVVGQSIESRLRLAGRKGGQGEAGWRTVARAAVLNDLKAAARMAPEGSDRGAVLDRLCEVGTRLERDGSTGESYPAQERIFYSRSGVDQVDSGGAGVSAFARNQGGVDQTQTPGFKRWYSGQNGKEPQGNDAGGAAGEPAAAAAGSKRSGPLDANGRPIVFFHGTRADISAFDVRHPNRKDSGWLGRGIYGTSDPDWADAYASAKQGPVGPNLMPLYFAVVNPYVDFHPELTHCHG